ncbi:MAG: TlpA family protein disulfide reductase [Proteobacteria bacterium]|nr:TlpA family protein disulfide reductase [Pseudomonadota bacterium]
MKLFALLLAASLSLLPPAHAAMPGEVAIGSALRDLPMQGLNGPSQKITAFRGKPLIVNVWASWCGPCRAEMGSLDRLAKRYGKQFTVIGISTDDYPDRARAFLKQSGTAFPMFIDSPPWPLEHMLGANRLPLTVLVAPDGQVLAKYYGAREWDSPASVAEISRVFKLKL